MRFFKNRYHGFSTKIFRQINLFKGVSTTSSYDETLRMKLNLEDWIQQQVYFLGYYDIRGINFIKNFLKQGDVFIDVGANIGCFSLIASKCVGSDGKVIAFEPVSHIINQLEYNLGLNQIKNVTLEKSALLDTSGSIDLHISNTQNMGMSSILRHDAEEGAIEKAPSTSLDDYIVQHSIQQINLIKMDIEGAELKALQGMNNTLQKLNPVILMEVSKDALINSDVTTDDVFAYMNEAGYVPYEITKKGKLTPYQTGSKDYHNFVFCLANQKIGNLLAPTAQ